MHEEHVMVIIAGIAGFVGVVSVISYRVQATLEAWFDSALKRDMVARGYTAQEIMAIVSTKRRGKWKATELPFADVPPAKPVRQPSYS